MKKLRRWLCATWEVRVLIHQPPKRDVLDVLLDRVPGKRLRALVSHGRVIAVLDTEGQ